uniref:Uncharacterized protein n=1 Tax=Arundo donax TaxID=35708 RepID=A0A0A9C5W1_ARUDO
MMLAFEVYLCFFL